MIKIIVFLIVNRIVKIIAILIILNSFIKTIVLIVDRIIKIIVFLITI